MCSYGRKIAAITQQRDARTSDFDGMIKTGKDLVIKKDVTDTAPVREQIKVNLHFIRLSVKLHSYTDCIQIYFNIMCVV